MALTIARRLIDDLGLARQLMFDSAGTHAGGNQKPDPRSVAALLKKGYYPPTMRSRRIVSKDFEVFDVILAMDSVNLEHLQKICPIEHAHKLHLLLGGEGNLLDASGTNLTEVPDPYYGPSAGFDYVLALCERGVARWIQRACPAAPSAC